MRQGVTGLVVGLVAGAILASGAAFATGMVVSAPTAPTSAIPPRSDGAVAQTKSVDPTVSVEATHGPDVKSPKAAEQKARSRKTAATRDRKQATESRSRSSQSAGRRSSVDSQSDASRGTVCAPTPVPDHESGGDDPGSGDHDMGEHHDGMGHE